jgi:hypothetical protein
MEDIYAPVVKQKLTGLSFMSIGADQLQALALASGAPAGWFSGAVRMAFEGGTEIYLDWKSTSAGDDLLNVGNRLEWAPFSLSEIVVWDGSWNEFVGSTFAGADFFSADGANVGLVRHRFGDTSFPKELWVGVGHEQLGVVGEGDDLFVAQYAPPSLASLKQLTAIAA